MSLGVICFVEMTGASADMLADVDLHPFPIYMFVVSGHLYRPLLSSQSWELGGKILGGFGTRPPPNVFRCRVKHPRVPLAPKPRGVRHMAWFKEP